MERHQRTRRVIYSSLHFRKTGGNVEGEFGAVRETLDDYLNSLERKGQDINKGCTNITKEDLRVYKNV